MTPTEFREARLRGRGWRTDLRMERDEGIPAGLPYLEAHVIHYAILAETEA